MRAANFNHSTSLLRFEIKLSEEIYLKLHHMYTNIPCRAQLPPSTQTSCPRGYPQRSIEDNLSSIVATHCVYIPAQHKVLSDVRVTDIGATVLHKFATGSKR
jgi:hypothetical protein